MKIMLILGFSNPFPGAAWRRISNFAKHLSKFNYEVWIVGTVTPVTINKIGMKKQKLYKIFNIEPHIGLLNGGVFLIDLFMSLILIFFIVLLRPNIIIVSVPPGEPLLGAFIGSKFSKSKIIVDYRDEWEEYLSNKTRSKITRKILYFLKKNLFLNIYKRVATVVTCSPKFMANLRKQGVKNLSLVPNGVNRQIFRPLIKKNVRRKYGFTERDIIIVYNGTVGSYYRVDLIANVIAKLRWKYKNIKFLIVGRGPATNSILTYAKKLGIEDILFLIESHHEKTVAELLSMSDIGIIPYDEKPLWKNSIPIKFFEYCAVGIPIIATAFEDSILAKLIKKFNVGIVCRPLDTRCLAKAIERILNNEKIYRKYSRNGPLIVKQYFDAAVITKKFLTVIRGIKKKDIKDIK